MIFLRNCNFSNFSKVLMCAPWRWSKGTETCRGWKMNIWIQIVVFYVLTNSAFVGKKTSHWYTILQDTEKTWPILNRPTLKYVIFLWTHKDKNFLGKYILTGGVFVTQLSSNAGISFWRIVWVVKNCCFMSDIVDKNFEKFYIINKKDLKM
jgi:hypothetical protein